MFQTHMTSDVEHKRRRLTECPSYSFSCNESGYCHCIEQISFCILVWKGMRVSKLSRAKLNAVGLFQIDN